MSTRLTVLGVVLVGLGGRAAEPPRPGPQPPAPAPKRVDPKLVAAAPEKYLHLTAARSSLHGPAGREEEPLRQFMKTHPDDPLSRLLTRDRAVIGKLIPLLTDRTPVWSSETIRLSDPGDRPRRQRVVCVGDVALAVIDYHSKCLFGGGDWEGFVIRPLPDEGREKLARRVADWWAANKDKSVAAGIRAAIPDADYDAKVVMAKRLFRLGNEDDKRHARVVLLAVFREHAGHHTSAAPALALAECGDLTPLDDIYKLWQPFVDQPGVYTYEPKLVRYLCAHGRRREWDLLYAIAESEIREKEKLPQGPSRVWSTVVGNAMYEKSPYTIPFLGLALTETQQTGVRWVGNPGMAQPYSAADTAAGLLQLRTGQDLGYKMESTADERKAAIERARAWWEKEGKAKYTFDSIEKNLLKKPDPKK